MKTQVQESLQMWENIKYTVNQQQCPTAQQMMNNCSSEDKCAKASLALTMCMAQVVYPVQHSALSSQLNVKLAESKEKEVLEYNAKEDAALKNVAVCVQGNDVK
eukprot:3798782-Ditylum_brightwellii.AAC.1